MHERIDELLRRIEREDGCRVLYACESGSRAWGFASPDSDYDVRFIYVYPVEWYLRLERRSDTIELMTPDKLDLSGWELGKALRLFAGCNLALNEWLDSPHVYFTEVDFLRALSVLVPTFFNPKKALHHYQSMAEKTIDEYLAGGTVGIKKAFYILRPLLACRWIIDKIEMPPTRFDDLLGQELPRDLSSEIQELLARKSSAAEGEKTCLQPVILDWIVETREFAGEKFAVIPTAPERNWKPLNRLMQQWVYAPQ